MRFVNCISYSCSAFSYSSLSKKNSSCSNKVFSLTTVSFFSTELMSEGDSSMFKVSLLYWANTAQCGCLIPIFRFFTRRCFGHLFLSLQLCRHSYSYSVDEEQLSSNCLLSFDHILASKSHRKKKLKM